MNRESFDAIIANAVAAEKEGNVIEGLRLREQGLIVLRKIVDPLHVEELFEAAEGFVRRCSAHGLKLLNANDLDGAFALMQQAASLTAEEGPLQYAPSIRRRVRAVAFNNLGLFYHRVRKNEAAAKHLHVACELEHGDRDAENPVATLVNYSIVLEALGQMPKAAAVALTACDVAEECTPESDCSKMLPAALRHCGRLHDIVGNYAQAAVCYDRAVSLLRPRYGAADRQVLELTALAKRAVDRAERFANKPRPPMKWLPNEDAASRRIVTSADEVVGAVVGPKPPKSTRDGKYGGRPGTGNPQKRTPMNVTVPRPSTAKSRPPNGSELPPQIFKVLSDEHKEALTTLVTAGAAATGAPQPLLITAHPSDAAGDGVTLRAPQLAAPPTLPTTAPTQDTTDTGAPPDPMGGTVLHRDSSAKATEGDEAVPKKPTPPPIETPNPIKVPMQPQKPKATGGKPVAPSHVSPSKRSSRATTPLDMAKQVYGQDLTKRRSTLDTNPLPTGRRTSGRPQPSNRSLGAPTSPSHRRTSVSTTSSDHQTPKRGSGPLDVSPSGSQTSYGSNRRGRGALRANNSLARMRRKSENPQTILSRFNAAETVQRIVLIQVLFRGKLQRIRYARALAAKREKEAFEAELRAKIRHEEEARAREQAERAMEERETALKREKAEVNDILHATRHSSAVVLSGEKRREIMMQIGALGSKLDRLQSTVVKTETFSKSAEALKEQLRQERIANIVVAQQFARVLASAAFVRRVALGIRKRALEGWSTMRLNEMSATKIQRLFQVTIARRRAEVLAYRKEQARLAKIFKNAATIQRFCRHLQSQHRAVECGLQFFHRRAAKIQALYRGVRDRALCVELEKERQRRRHVMQFNRAIMIQKIFRVFKSRAERTKRFQQVVSSNQEAKPAFAATVIQRNWRKMAPRKAFVAYITKKHTEEADARRREEEQRIAVATLARAQRIVGRSLLSYFAKRRLEYLRRQKLEAKYTYFLEEMRAHCARKLQAFLRIVMAKLLLRQKKKMREEIIALKEWRRRHEEEEAKERAEFRLQIANTTKAQALWRGYACRKRLLDEKKRKVRLYEERLLDFALTLVQCSLRQRLSVSQRRRKSVRPQLTAIEVPQVGTPVSGFARPPLPRPSPVHAPIPNVRSVSPMVTMSVAFVAVYTLQRSGRGMMARCAMLSRSSGSGLYLRTPRHDELSSYVTPARPPSSVGSHRTPRNRTPDEHAMAIQRAHKSHSARQRTASAAKESRTQSKRDAVATDAAVTIQSLLRGAYARRQVRLHGTPRTNSRQQRRESIAAETIQAVYRGHAGRQYAGILRREVGSESERRRRVRDGATAMVSAVLGNARRRTGVESAPQSSPPPPNASVEDPPMEGSFASAAATEAAPLPRRGGATASAAAAIQRQWKTFAQRRAFLRVRDTKRYLLCATAGALEVQCFARMLTARRHLRQRQNSVQQCIDARVAAETEAEADD